MLKYVAIICTASALSALAGCSGTATTLTGGGTVPLTMVAQATPSKTTSIPSFRVQVTSAVLSPGNVQLVAAPVSIDLAQATSGSAFLSSAKASAGTYSSMTVTFANPSISITNTTSSATVIPGGSCAPHSTCTFAPTIKNSQSTITTGVFPLTVSSGTAKSFALTMAEEKILQADDSVDFGSGGVDSGTDQSGNSENDSLDAQVGVVQSFSSGQLVLASESNQVSPSILSDANTVYNFPAPLCAANNATCLITGEIVTASLSLTAAGVVHADSISYADAPNTKLVEGIITSVASGGHTFQMRVDQSFGLSNGSDESTLTVTVQSGTSFGIGTVGYPTIPGGAFAGIGDLLAGQAVLVDVSGSSVLPNVTTSQIFLTDSDTNGMLSALASNSFLLTTYSEMQDNSSPTTSQVMVQTGISTSFRNFLPASFSSLANGQSVSARGPLFNVPSAPMIAATQVSLHSSTDQ